MVDAVAEADQNAQNMAKNLCMPVCCLLAIRVKMIR